MIEYLVVITVIGLLSGVLGTATGGLFVVLFKETKERVLSILLGFSAGVMVAIAFMELVPESIEEGSLFTALLGIIIGIAIIGFLDIYFPHHHFSFDINGNGEKVKQLKTGILLSIGIAMHNLPEGVAIGTAFLVNFEVGLSLAVLMAIHNFPEGMAAATAMGVGKVKNTKILSITALAGVPMGIGAFFGGLLGGVSEFALSIGLGFAAGAMLYIVFDELVPDSHRRATGHTAIIGILLGIVTGIAFIGLLH